MTHGEGRRILVILALTGTVLAVGLWHGLPQVYVPDTHIIRNALGMAQSRDLWPPAGAYSTYPYFLSYLLLPLYGITFLAGRTLGFYESAQDFGHQVVENPTLVYLEARILVALFGLIAVYYLYRTARRINLSPNVSMGAALLLAFNPLFVQLGHHARPWIPLVAGMVFTLYHAAGMALEARRRDYVLASMGAGMAFATHQVGASVLLIPLVVHFTCQRKRVFKMQGIGFAFLILALFTAVSFCLGYGHNVLGGEAQEVVQTEQSALDIGGQKFLLGHFSGTRAGKVAWAFFGYDPVGSTLGVIGLLLGIFGGAFQGLRLALGVFCGIIASVFLLYDGTHIRYLLPLAPALALGSSFVAFRFAKALGRHELLFILPLVMFGGIQSGRMDVLLCRLDTRDLARAWVEKTLPEGTRIAAEGYTAPLVPDRESLTFLRDVAGVWLKRRERMLLAGEGDSTYEPRYFLIPLERFYRYESYWPHQYLQGGEKPIAEFLEERETEWIMLSDRWPWMERHPPLVEYLKTRTLTRRIFSPSDTEKPCEATLPTDMDFPLMALWKLDRPGPLVRLFEVKME